MSWLLPLLCLGAIIVYSHLWSSAARIGLAWFASPDHLSCSGALIERFSAALGIWIGSVVAAPVLTLGVLRVVGWRVLHRADSCPGQ